VPEQLSRRIPLVRVRRFTRHWALKLSFDSL
jgi:hypothetical protein